MDVQELNRIGKNIYEACLEYQDVYFVFCPCSLGDTVNIAIFLNTFKRIYNKNKILLILKERQSDLGGIFSGADGIFPISENECLALRYYVQMNGLYRSNNFLYGYFPMNGNDFWGTQHKMCLTFVDEYKSDILQIPLDSEIDSINLPRNDVAEYSQYEGAVIIMPWCQTLGSIDINFWKEIINFYRSKGIRVYTNIGNPGDEVIEGSLPCNLSISELLFVSPLFKRIIGIRSGIFDALALRSDVKLDVIYPGLIKYMPEVCELDSSRHPLYFGLKHLNHSVQGREYLYVPGCEKKLFCEIVSKEVN